MDPGRFSAADIHPRVLIMAYYHAIQNLVTPEFFAQVPLSAPQIFDQVLHIIIEGILDGFRPTPPLCPWPPRGNDASPPSKGTGRQKRRNMKTAQRIFRRGLGLLAVF